MYNESEKSLLETSNAEQLFSVLEKLLTVAH